MPVAAYAYTVVTGEAKLVNYSASSSSWEILFFSLHPEASRKHRRDKRRKIVLPVTLCSDLDRK